MASGGGTFDDSTPHASVPAVATRGARGARGAQGLTRGRPGAP